MAFSASDAAFEGFRLTRRAPLAIVIWALAYLLFVAAVVALMGGSMAALMTQAAALEGIDDPSPEQLLPAIGAYLSMMGVLMPLSLLFGAVLYTAVNRAVLRPQEKAFGYLRLGADELRVLVVYLVLMVLAIILSAVLFGAVGLIAGLTAAAAENLAALIGVVGAIAAICLFVWLLVRFSLALPITVAERRIAIFDSWSLTRGHFWGLLGMAILAIILSFVVQLLAWMVFMPFMFLMGGGLAHLAGADLQGEDLMQVITALGPVAIVAALMIALVSALQLAIVYAPFAAAYRGLKGDGTAEPVPAPEPTPTL